MENPPQRIDAKIDDLRKNVDAFTTNVITHLNKINRLLREIQQSNPK